MKNPTTCRQFWMFKNVVITIIKRKLAYEKHYNELVEKLLG